MRPRTGRKAVFFFFLRSIKVPFFERAQVLLARSGGAFIFWTPRLMDVRTNAKAVKLNLSEVWSLGEFWYRRRRRRRQAVSGWRSGVRGEVYRGRLV